MDGENFEREAFVIAVCGLFLSALGTILAVISNNERAMVAGLLAAVLFTVVIQMSEPKKK